MSVRPFFHQRPLTAAAAAFGAGIWTGAHFSWRPFAFLLGGAICLLAVFLLPRIGRRRIAGWLGVFFFGGLLLAGSALHPVLPPAGRYQAEGIVCADAEMREDGSVALYLDQVKLQSGGAVYRMNRVYWTYTPDADSPFLPLEGDSVSFEGRLYAPSGQTNPYGFDFRLFLLQKGAQAGITGMKDGQVTGHPGRGLRTVTYAARETLSDRMHSLFGANSALPEALLLGIRDEVPKDVRQSFTDAGVAHVLAVSGLHTALLAGTLMLFLRRFAGVRTRFAALCVFLLLYCALLDFSAPVARASILLALAYFRRIVRRAPDRLTCLSAAFLLILLFRPLDLFSASFQLSFCAVLGITLFLPFWERRRQRIRRSQWLPDSLGVTLAATFGAAIPTAQTFHRLSLIGVAINPFVCGVFSLLLPLYALALLLSFLWLPGAVWLAGVLGAATNGVVQCVQAVGGLPFAVCRVPYLPWYCVMALAAAGLLATRLTVWPGRRKAMAAVLLLTLSFGGWQAFLCRDVQYIQLSVGQADSALLTDGAETVVIDCGDYGGDLASYLLSTGRQADHVILTHLHSDHCMGLRQLLDQRVPIGEIILPVGAEEQLVDPACLALLDEIRGAGVPVRHVQAGDSFRTARTSFTVTWPEGDRLRAGQDANRTSLAMLIDAEGFRILTAGDLVGTYEMYAARDADALKTAHHGSKNSTGEEFLRAVTPEIALISASANENALLPSEETLGRLAAAGIPWYNTGESGALILTIRQGKGRVMTFLQ